MRQGEALEGISMLMSEEGAREAEQALAARLTAALTMELAQPLLNSHRRKGKPRGWTDAPLFHAQEELPL